eukprot:g4488.t1
MEESSGGGRAGQSLDALRAALGPALWAARAAFVCLAAAWLWDEALRLVLKGDEIWAGSSSLRRRASSPDAAVFMEAWRTWFAGLVRSFWGGLGERLADFVVSRARAPRPYATLFLCLFMAKHFRIHSIILVQLDNAGLSFLSSFIIRACSYIPFLGGDSVGSIGEGHFTHDVYDDDVPDLFDEDDDGADGREENDETELPSSTTHETTETMTVFEETSPPAPLEVLPPAPTSSPADVPDSDGAKRPAGWLVFDSTYGVIPHEVAARWKQNDLESERRRDQSRSQARGKDLPPVRSPR